MTQPIAYGARDFDLIVYGATGCARRLLAEYPATSYRGDDAPSWAIAGRSTDKLQRCVLKSAHPTIYL
jgi:short subunit dehydrogenase-like uncharacterized protein